MTFEIDHNITAPVAYSRKWAAPWQTMRRQLLPVGDTCTFTPFYNHAVLVLAYRDAHHAWAVHEQGSGAIHVTRLPDSAESAFQLIHNALPTADPDAEPRGRSYRYPFPEMAAGDSFWVADEANAYSAQIAAHTYAAKTLKGFMTAREDEGLRLWRIA